MSSFDWSEYRVLARDLCNTNVTTLAGGEARYRCAISRAYYGAFISARNYLRSTNENRSADCQDGGSHDRIIRYFNEHNNKLYRSIGTKLNRMKLARVRADYHDAHGWNNLYAQALETVQNADIVIGSIHHLTSSAATVPVQ